MSDDDYLVATDCVAALAHRVVKVIDLPTAEQLALVLADAGWVADPTRPSSRFTAGEFAATVHVERGGASIRVVLADLGTPDDEDDEYDDDGNARDRMYINAKAAANALAGRIDLPPADPLAADQLGDYGDRALFRAGHWAVGIGAVQDDAGLPILLEADLSYGADLPGRLAQLAGAGGHGGPVDWDAVAARIGVRVPRDYRWLMERYGPGTFDGYLTLMSPQQLSAPVFGPSPVGVLRYVKLTLPVATTADGAVVCWVVEGEDGDRWQLRVTGPDSQPWDVWVGLLPFLVITLSGAYRVPLFRSDFPSGTPVFRPAG